MQTTLTTVHYCPGDVVLRFLNSLGGVDTVLFHGNSSRSVQSTYEAIAKRVKDFSSTGDAGRETVIKTSVGERIECTRQFPMANREGILQLFQSKNVQVYYSGKWYDVQLIQKDWNDKIKENAFVVTIEIKLPDRINE